MARDGKAARKRAKGTGDGGHRNEEPRERSVLKRLRRLGADLAEARRTEARRSKQLASARAAVADVTTRIAELGATSDRAAEAARELLASTSGRAGDMAAPTPGAEGPGTEVTATSAGVGQGGDGAATIATPARRARRPRGAAPAKAATTTVRRTRTRVAAAPAAAIGGGTDTPRVTTRRRSARATVPAQTSAAVETPAPGETEAPAEAAAPAETVAPAEIPAPAETVAPAEIPAPAETVAPAEIPAPAEASPPTDVGPATEAQDLVPPSTPAAVAVPSDPAAAVVADGAELVDQERSPGAPDVHAGTTGTGAEAGALGEAGNELEARRFLRPADDAPDAG